MLYLDVLASYPMLAESQATLAAACSEHFANPSANHLLGENAKAQVERVRHEIADSIGALPSEIIFTSGATESNNLILKGVLLPLLQSGQKPHMITSAIEHKCILEICAFLEVMGCEVTYLSPQPSGIITAESVRNAIQENTVLISLMHVNNELGTVNDIGEIGSVCFENDIKFHTDAAQSFLKEPIDINDLNIDFLSISAHKIGGPKGIGAAFVRDLRSSGLQPLIHGAGQESGMRGGTLATPLILSFGEAVTHFPQYYNKKQLEEHKQYFLDELIRLGAKYHINGGGKILPLMANISFVNIDIPALMREKHYEYALSEGSACSSGAIEPSHVLLALSLDRETASKTLRISFPLDIQKDQLKKLALDILQYQADE